MLKRFKLPENFRESDAVRDEIKQSCAANSDIAEYRVAGKSEGGRPVDVVILGNGAKTVSLIAGSHSDEPVGPETLRMFICEILRHREAFADILADFRFVIFPHINPDGEAKNQSWIRKWPDVSEFIHHVFREQPGQDIEFGYPEMRSENRVATEIWREFGPFDLHISLHGMAFSEGAMLLIDRNWIEQTERIQQKFVLLANELGLRRHDHDRGGEKGFDYIAPGFTTTPEGRAMQAYFLSQNDPQTAEKFHLSSMEFIRSLGGDPLCLVTELPLFIVENPSLKYTGTPERYLAFKEKLPALRLKLANGESIAKEIKEFGLKPLDFQNAVRFQLKVIQWGLDTVRKK